MVLNYARHRVNQSEPEAIGKSAGFHRTLPVFPRWMVICSITLASVLAEASEAAWSSLSSPSIRLILKSCCRCCDSNCSCRRRSMMDCPARAYWPRHWFRDIGAANTINITTNSQRTALRSTETV